MTKRLSKKYEKDLYKAIAQLGSTDECKKFLRDLCTMAEISAMSERFRIVRMVAKGMPYRDISKITGSSTATITRVAHWFRHGKGGYKLVLENFK